MAEDISMAYFPGYMVLSRMPPALRSMLLAKVLICIVSLKCGSRSLWIGCIALSCLLAAMMNGSTVACVNSLLVDASRRWCCQVNFLVVKLEFHVDIQSFRNTTLVEMIFFNGNVEMKFAKADRTRECSHPNTEIFRKKVELFIVVTGS